MRPHVQQDAEATAGGVRAAWPPALLAWPGVDIFPIRDWRCACDGVIIEDKPASMKVAYNSSLVNRGAAPATGA
jgi:hypothetical protein